MKKAPVRYWLPDKNRTLEGIDPDLRALLKALSEGKARWPFYLYGPPGCGKSCAALMLLDYAGGFYFTAEEMAEAASAAAFGRLRTPSGERAVGSIQLWSEISACELFVLDELGARKTVGEHHYMVTKRVLDRREGKPLIVIANCDMDAIRDLYGGPVASRLASGTQIFMDRPDRRMER